VNCRELEGLLPELLEGTIEGIDHARCVAHRAACASCAELLEPMGDRLVPVSAEPPEAFLAGVLQRTSRAPVPESWAAFWRRLVLRPRFASEVAYVCVAAFCVVCAAVGDVSADARSRKAGVLIQEICSEAGVLADRATSLFTKEKP
jgi:hypothetical protein